MSFNLATILEETAAADPERAFLHVGDESIGFGHVDELARRVAGSLLERGLVPGDRVVVQLPNIPEFVYAYFGILKAGLVMVPVNPQLVGPEIAYQVADSGARLMITHATTLDTARAGVSEVDGVALLAVGGGDQDEYDFSSLLLSEPIGSSHPTASDDLAVVLYTSGTTGKPKGAELTHFQLFLNCTVSGELFDLGPEDVMTAALPLFHVFGLSSVLNVAVRYGAQLVLLRRFDLEDLLEAIERHRITVFSGVPTMYFALLQTDPVGRDLRSLKVGISGGAAIPAQVVRDVEKKFPGLVVLEGYGLSETTSVASFNIDAERRKVGSIGKPIWGIEMRIIDEGGRELGPGSDQVGEIVVRGHNIMRGYFNRPDATAEVLRDGWFHTGDLGFRDDDGYFYVADRLKDLIIRGGYNVYPREVEEVLYEHPDVVEAAVVGSPDERVGEEILAFVVLRAGSTTDAAGLDAHCRARLATYKYPREYRLIDVLPKSASGKILKRQLRDGAD